VTTRDLFQVPCQSIATDVTRPNRVLFALALPRHASCLGLWRIREWVPFVPYRIVDISSTVASLWLQTAAL